LDSGDLRWRRQLRRGHGRNEFHRGRLITKLFAGIEAVDQHIAPFDPNNAIQGSELGARFLAENWIDLSAAFYLSVDAAYGTAFQDYWSRGASAIGSGQDCQLGSKAAHSATKNMMRPAPVGSFASIS